MMTDPRFWSLLILSGYFIFGPILFWLILYRVGHLSANVRNALSAYMPYLYFFIWQFFSEGSIEPIKTIAVTLLFGSLFFGLFSWFRLHGKRKIALGILIFPLLLLYTLYFAAFFVSTYGFSTPRVSEKEAAQLIESCHVTSVFYGHRGVVLGVDGAKVLQIKRDRYPLDKKGKIVLVTGDGGSIPGLLERFADKCGDWYRGPFPIE